MRLETVLPLDGEAERGDVIGFAALRASLRIWVVAPIGEILNARYLPARDLLRKLNEVVDCARLALRE
jgi:hypothetical protein